MNAPSKHLEVMVVSQKVRHGGNPVLRWMMSNARIQSDPAGNIKPTKQKSTEKIDGVVAAVMGLGRWMASEEEERSVYETRGVIEL
jgi:phage terminase large subunit-like protein